MVTEQQQQLRICKNCCVTIYSLARTKLFGSSQQNSSLVHSVLLFLDHWLGLEMHTIQYNPSWWHRSLNPLHTVDLWEQNLFKGSAVLEASKAQDSCFPTTYSIFSLTSLFVLCLRQKIIGWSFEVIRERSRPTWCLVLPLWEDWNLKSYHMLMHFKHGPLLPLCLPGTLVEKPSLHRGFCKYTFKPMTYLNDFVSQLFRSNRCLYLVYTFFF